MSSGHYCDGCARAYYNCICNKEDKVQVEETKQEINDYLSSGGLFNPEMANHKEIRGLLIDMRALLDRIESRLQ